MSMPTPLSTPPLNTKPQQRHRYDEELGCFVLLGSNKQGNTANERLAFCHRLSNLTDDGETFTQQLTQLLDSLALDRQFYGATLRIGTWINPSVDQFAAEHLAIGAVADTSPIPKRREILRELAFENARHVLNPVRLNESAFPRYNNYDYFIQGSVPADPGNIQHSRAVLQELNERVFCYLLDKKPRQDGLNEAQYSAFADVILNVPLEEPNASPLWAEEPFATRRFAHGQTYGFRMDPTFNLPPYGRIVEESAPPTIFDPWNWQISGNMHRPGHFMITTTYHVLDRASYKDLLSAQSASMKFRARKASDPKQLRVQRETAYMDGLADAINNGEGMVAVEVEGYGIGASAAGAEKEARQFVHFMRSHGFIGEFAYVGPTPTGNCLPLALDSIDRHNATLAPIQQAVALAPTMGATIQTRRQGLQLITQLGQPTYFDFMCMDGTPLTVLTGAAGSGKGYLVAGMISHCLAQRMPVFAITDNTYSPQQVTAIGGHYFGASTNAGPMLAPFNLRKHQDNKETTALALSYIFATASLFGPIPAPERVAIESWFNGYCQSTLSGTFSTVGLNLPLILAAMSSEKVNAPTVIDRLQPFAFDGEYAHLASLQWSTDLSRDEFTVIPVDHGEIGWHTPPAIRLAAYLTKISLGRNLFQRPNKSVPAMFVMQDVRVLLESTPEVNHFLQQIIKSAKANNCAIVATVTFADELFDSACGKWLAAKAQHLVCLQQRPEIVYFNEFKAMFPMTRAQAYMFDRQRTRRGGPSEMMIHSRGHVGMYRYAPSPFALAMADQGLLWKVQQQTDAGASYLEAIENQSRLLGQKAKRQPMASDGVALAI